jgi:hypothetical protein
MRYSRIVQSPAAIAYENTQSSNIEHIQYASLSKIAIQIVHTYSTLRQLLQIQHCI